MDQGLRVTYLGQCGFLLDDGHTRLVTDPYLSDYVDQVVSSAAWPWQRLYPPPTDLKALAPDIVLISHAHEDHMDPWTLQAYRQAGGTAQLICPAPEVTRLHDLGFERVIGARAGEAIQLGSVTIIPFPCAHTQFHQDAKGDYRELSYVIEVGGSRVLFGGDMSLYEGLEAQLRDHQLNLLLLPVNDGDAYRTQHGIIGNMSSQEAAGLSARLGVPYVPMHHDLYANNGCPQATIEADAKAAGAVLRSLSLMQALTLPPWPRLCVLGAGLSGRGFLGRLLSGQAQLTFIDSDQALSERLKQAGHFMVRRFDGSPLRAVGGFEALWTGDPACEGAMQAADAVLSCVRAQNAPAAGEWLRATAKHPLPVIACENALDPAATLRLPEPWQVASAAIFCTTVAGEGLDILSEEVEALIVSEGAASRVLEGLSGFKLTNAFDQLMLRKIYTYNAASAIIAYLGAKLGYEEFSQAARDPLIDRELDLFYDEVNLAIENEYGVAPSEQARFAADSKTKFANPRILDSVSRNAANPERKLSARERIIAPARLIMRHGGSAQPLVKTAAAALHYAQCDRDSARRLLEEVAQLDPQESLYDQILAAFDQA